MIRIPPIAWLICATAGAACSDRTYTAAPPRLNLVEDLRLDANDEDFSVVRWVYVGPRREIVVPLLQDMHVRMYDSAGSPIATVGRYGSGPGEFRHVGRIMWVGDTLFVYDARQRRITHVSADGTVLRTSLVPPPFVPVPLDQADSSFTFFNPSARLADGVMLGTAQLNVASGGGGPASAERVMLLIPRNGRTRVVATLPRNDDERWFMNIAGFGNPVPFAFQPQVATASDGSRFAFLTADHSSQESAMYTVGLFRSNGDTIFHRSYPFRGTPIPQNAVDSALAAMAPRTGQPTEGPPDLAARFQALARKRVPPIYSPVQRIRLGLDHTVWIDLYPGIEGQITLVLDETGEPLATVVVPPRSRIQQASLSYVWVTEVDEYGLASIVRYRVTGPSTRARP